MREVRLIIIHTNNHHILHFCLEKGLIILFCIVESLLAIEKTLAISSLFYQGKDQGRKGVTPSSNKSSKSNHFDEIASELFLFYIILSIFKSILLSNNFFSYLLSLFVFYSSTVSFFIDFSNYSFSLFCWNFAWVKVSVRE